MKASERVTIMLDNKLAAKLRLLQSKEIADTQRTVSFSKVINDMITKGFKNAKA